MEKGMKTVKCEGAVHSFYARAHGGSSSQVSSYSSYMIFKATKKLEHRYFLFLGLTILLKALSTKDCWVFFLREQRIGKKIPIPKFIYTSSVGCELELDWPVKRDC